VTSRRVGFSQVISVRTGDSEALVQLLADWDELQSTVDVMGYTGTHVLADRDDPGHYLVVAEFSSVDPDVPAFEEALRNNERPETQEWARRLLELVDGEPVYSHFDELYRTDL
jgi:hypothetical protein